MNVPVRFLMIKGQVIGRGWHVAFAASCNADMRGLDHATCSLVGPLPLLRQGPGPAGRPR